MKNQNLIYFVNITLRLRLSNSYNYKLPCRNLTKGLAILYKLLINH